MSAVTAKRMSSIETLHPRVLVPYDPREALTTREAALIARKTEGTIRLWCEAKGIGRRIQGAWAVSRVALQMLLEGDDYALTLYQAGNRQSDEVVRYFREIGLSELLFLRQFQQP